MKKWLSILFASAMLLSGCNVQTVSEYDKEMARLQAQDKDEEVIDVNTHKEETQREKDATKSETKEDPKTQQKEEEQGKKEQSSSSAEQHSVLTEKPENVVASESKVVEKTTKVIEDEPKASVEQKQSAQPEQNQTTQPEKKSAPKEETTHKPASIATKKETEKTVDEKPKASHKEHEATKRTEATPSAPKKPAVSHEAEKEVVTVSVRVDTLLKPEHYKRLPETLQQRKYVPANGIIIEASKYTIEKGDTAWTATRKALQKNNIHFEYEGEGESGYGSIYVEGINHIYEKQAGSLSGWMYAVNGKAPSVGASSYEVKDGDHITWHYTTNLGRDIGLAD